MLQCLHRSNTAGTYAWMYILNMDRSYPQVLCKSKYSYKQAEQVQGWPINTLQLCIHGCGSNLMRPSEPEHQVCWKPW